MKEKPILFSGPMVRSILEGRKTQTRRVVKPQSSDPDDGFGTAGPEFFEHGGRFFRQHVVRPGELDAIEIVCPYGQPGDRLWVKETFKVNGTFAGPRVTYRADGAVMFPSGCPDDCPDWIADDNHWRPSIFMRRYASRLTLEITAVRVERLQDISEANAKAEGAPKPTGRRGAWPAPWATAKAGPCDYRESYQKLWETINGPGSWEKNPWVWVIEFRRTQPA